MTRSSRIPRQLPDLLKALDDHQYLLRGALYGVQEDLAHIKTLATELRTLVCLSSGTEGLLWRVADQLDVSDVIELQVAKSVNRNHPLNRSLTIWKLPMSRPGEGPPGPPAEQHRLRDVIKACEAIYVSQIHDRVLTHELLIMAIAGQMAAHEAEGLDHFLVKAGSLLVNNAPAYLQVLVFDAELVLQVVERVLDSAERGHGFRRAARPPEYGDVTLCVRFARRQILAGIVPIVTMRSRISETRITLSAGPRSAIFTLGKRGRVVAEMVAPYPPEWQMSDDALFTLSYSSAFRQACAITNDRAIGQAVPCDCGWLDARELRLESHSGYEDFVIPRCVPLYGRLLSPAECGQLLHLAPDGAPLRT